MLNIDKSILKFLEKSKVARIVKTFEQIVGSIPLNFKTYSDITVIKCGIVKGTYKISERVERNRPTKVQLTEFFGF